MAVQDLPELWRKEFPKVVGHALADAEAYVAATPPSAKDFANLKRVGCFRLAGDAEIAFAIGMKSEVGEEVLADFLTRHLGAKTLTDISTDAALLEITNIIAGQFTGRAENVNCTLEIADPGAIISAADFLANHPEPTITEAMYLSCGSVDDAKGVVWACTYFRLAPTKVETEAVVDASDDRTSVLIVDDSPVMRAFLEKTFKEAGYNVVGAAADGVEAIEKFVATQPDIMTLDIIMPKMRGTEVLNRIMEGYPEAKVIMASSVSDAKTVMQCLKIGAKRYIMKPYDKDAVLQAVEKVLKIKS